MSEARDLASPVIMNEAREFVSSVILNEAKGLDEKCTDCLRLAGFLGLRPQNDRHFVFGCCVSQDF